MVLLLLASAVLVFFVTVLGVGSCSSDACTSRATVAVLGSLVLHAVAIGVAVCLVLRRMATLPRVLMLVLLAVGVPVGTFFGSFLLVSSGQG